MTGIGEASSIIGILAAAVQATRVLADFSIEVRDATADAIAIGEDAQALSGILTTLQKWLLTGAIRPAAAASLAGTLNACLLTTNQLKIVIEPYTHSVCSRSRWIWRSLRWTLNKQEVRELRERWLQSKSTLGISLNIVTAYAIQTGYENIKEQIEAGNATVLKELEHLKKSLTEQKDNEIDGTSTRGKFGSTSNKTDSNFQLHRYLESLPMEGHPWASTSEPWDILSMDGTETAFCTPDIDASVADDTLRTVMTETVIPKANEGVYPDPNPDLKLVAVVSGPTPRSKNIATIDSLLPVKKIDPDTVPPRSISLPYPGPEDSSHSFEPHTESSHSLKPVHQIGGPLHQALFNENTYGLVSLLKTDLNVNELDRQKRTPVHVCALLNDKITAQALLGTGRVDLSMRDAHGRTPLQCALEVGNESLACLLLNNGASLEEVACFIVETMHRMRSPADEKVAHACLAWLSNRNDLRMQNVLVDALVARSGSSTASVTRFLEGTPFRESYIRRSSVQSRSRSMDSRQKASRMGPDASLARLGVEEYFGTSVVASSLENTVRANTLSPVPVIRKSVLWRLSKPE